MGNKQIEDIMYILLVPAQKFHIYEILFYKYNSASKDYPTSMF